MGKRPGHHAFRCSCHQDLVLPAGILQLLVDPLYGSVRAGLSVTVCAASREEAESDGGY
jgi:hypothetical protein